MASMDSIKLRRAFAAKRVVRALGIELPKVPPGTPHFEEYREALTLEAVANALEGKPAGTPPPHMGGPAAVEELADDIGTNDTTNAGEPVAAGESGTR